MGSELLPWMYGAKEKAPPPPQTDRPYSGGFYRKGDGRGNDSGVATGSRWQTPPKCPFVGSGQRQGTSKEWGSPQASSPVTPLNPKGWGQWGTTDRGPEVQLASL